MSVDKQAIIAANAEYIKTYCDDTNPSPIPRKKLAIVTCMDAWIHEAEAFDLELGDAHIIRNAGGSAKEALRSLIVSQHFLETTRVWVVKHTRCGMCGLTNADIHARVMENINVSAEHIDFMPFPKLAQAVRDDVAWLKAHELMSGVDEEDISGWIFHLEDGTMEPIC